MALVTHDVVLQGEIWTETINKLVIGSSNKGKIFPFYYSLFFLCAAIGINEDEIVEEFEPGQGDQKSIPRAAQSNISSQINYFYETAVLSSKCLKLKDEERVKMAFSDKEINLSDRMQYLLKFANYGVTKIKECISEVDEDTIDKIIEMCEKLYKHREIDKILEDLE